jgi:hypothetical protein
LTTPSFSALQKFSSVYNYSGRTPDLGKAKLGAGLQALLAVHFLFFILSIIHPLYAQ